MPALKGAKIIHCFATNLWSRASYITAKAEPYSLFGLSIFVMQDNDFLEGYEIKNWEYTPRLYKIWAAAAVINLLSIIAIGQTNMLTQAACKSPFVNRVCSVLDAVYVSGKILTTNAGYVVKEYEETKIRDSDVVWVDQTNVEPMLKYPDGYFQIANKDEPLSDNPEVVSTPTPLPIQPPPSPVFPPIPRTIPGMGSLSDNQVLPRKQDDLIEGDLPTDPLGDIEEDTSPKTSPGDGTVAETPGSKNPLEDDTARESDPISGPENINKKPLYDFADAVLEKVTNRTVDLKREFRVVMNGVITEEGRLDVEKSSWVTEQDEGDQAMITLAKDAVEKVGDSGWLIYLSDQDIKDVRIILLQDEEQLAANIVSVMPNENEAKRTASGFRLLLRAALTAHKNGIKKFKDDELTLLNAAEFTSEGNVLKINFKIEKDIAQKIIDERLKEYQANKEKKRLETPVPAKPNGGLGKFAAGERIAR